MDKKLMILLVCLFLMLVSARNGNANFRDRREKLTKAISSKNIELRVRAVYELASNIGGDTVLQGLLANQLVYENTDLWLLMAVKLLSKADASLTEKIIQAYVDANSPQDKFERLLFVFARMQTKAQSAIPFVLKHLDKYKENPKVEGEIRVVLANIGYKSNENLATILSDIRNRTDRGKSEVAMMSLGGCGEWVNNEILAELIKWLDGEGDIDKWLGGEEVQDAAIALASLGQRAGGAVPKLENLLKYVWQKKEHRSSRVIFGICLARIDSSHLTIVFKDVLKCMGSDTDHTDAAMLTWINHLIGADFVREIGKNLNDEDQEIVKGAVTMLGFMGVDAKEYTSKLIEILKESTDEYLRLIAAQGLRGMGDACDIPLLENALNKEESEIVRDEITDTIRILRLEEQKE